MEVIVESLLLRLVVPVVEVPPSSSSSSSSSYFPTPASTDGEEVFAAENKVPDLLLLRDLFGSWGRKETRSVFCSSPYTRCSWSLKPPSRSTTVRPFLVDPSEQTVKEPETFVEKSCQMRVGRVDPSVSFTVPHFGLNSLSMKPLINFVPWG